MKRYLILFALAASMPAFAQAGPVGAPGRYIIVHSPHVQTDTVLLDTTTGKTWRLTQDSSRAGEAVAWVPMARTDNPAEMQQFLRDHPPKK